MQENKLPEIESIEQEDGSVLYKPKVIFDGDAPHSHRYVERGTDKDGLMNVFCTGCPMGNMFKPITHKLVDGRIVSLNIK